MKLKNIIFVALLVTPFFLFSKKPVFAAACGSGTLCYYKNLYFHPYCGGSCAVCPWCTTSTPEEPTEGVTGEVINPVLDELNTMSGATFLSNFLKTGVKLVLIVGAVVFFFILTSGGIRWLSSSGDKATLESAQKQITSGLVGLVILLSSFAIIELIGTLFGIDLLNITLPTL